MVSSPSPSHTSHGSHGSHGSGDDDDDSQREDQHEREHEQDDDNEGSSSTKIPALKDKECQYCHQKFTSSSLGRHLDQFISKKKPDGIHNVDEIRRLRGGITRRTARSAQKKEQDETQPGSHSPSLQYTLPSYSELVNKTSTKEDVRFNRPHWQASGVITDTSASNTHTSAPAPAVILASPAVAEPSTSSNVVAGQKRTFSAYVSDGAAGTSSETVRALELSLREILDVVRTATQKATPPPRPFDFEFESQTFPYLCLALLQPPPTLFQSTPFATPNSIPIAAPGVDQYQSLRKIITLRIDDWKWNALSYIQRRSVGGLNMAEEAEALSEQTQTFMDSSLAHLDAAYQNYMSYGPESRHNLWTIEILRALKTEQDRVSSGKSAAERLTQEINQLQQQLDHLSRCQWPREMALWPPERPTFDGATQDELRKLYSQRGPNKHSSTDSNTPSNTNSDLADELARNNDRWDYERLVAKWRRHVREDRARRTGLQPAVSILQPGYSPGPTGSSDQLLNSPKPSTTSTPRISSSLYRSATMAPSSADYITGPRPISSTGVVHMAIGSAENSPRSSMDNIMNGIHHPSTSSAPPLGTKQGYTPSFSPGLGAQQQQQQQCLSGISSATAGITAANATNTGVGGGGSGGGGAGTTHQTSIFGNIPPPPRSRPLGIISDVDEHYGPRLMGLRGGEPPRK